MITIEFVNNAISKVVERFEENNYIRRTYHEVICEEGYPEEIHFFIEDEIDMLLNGLGVNHNVELVEAYEGPGFDIWVVSVAFVVDGEICQHNMAVERHY